MRLTKELKNKILTAQKNEITEYYIGLAIRRFFNIDA